ncbi:tripartite motif-containing protein 16-like [Boleophthalmus pectinirostris]|uniref:tripartite motif-containing protein 16-like n=1 Tax=Boleophthalmus pectinirostris TaxID=150288 RepID=UPI00242D8B60|nr:tripartite motif-containing protein 16-like [Boleophthalmus pectinirostris]
MTLKYQQIICYLCSVDQHKGHNTVSSAAERAQRQAQLQANKSLLFQSLQHKETDLKKLQQDALPREHCSKRDICDLKKTISELDTLSLTPDHNQFILHCPPLSTLTKRTESSVQIGLKGDFEDMTRAVSVLRDKVQLTIREFKLPQPGLCTREDFIRYSQDIKMDPNTAHKQLSLFDGNRRVTVRNKEQRCPDHPERFVEWRQVMSRESLTGCCYWEVEWSGDLRVRIAVSYRDIKRQGTPTECLFGDNDKSWALYSTENKYSFWFNNVESKVSGPFSSRIGVYLDHSAGLLSFYSVKGQSMNLLHKVHTNFTQPLFTGVRFYTFGDTAHFIKLK